MKLPIQPSEVKPYKTIHPYLPTDEDTAKCQQIDLRQFYEWALGIVPSGSVSEDGKWFEVILPDPPPESAPKRPPIRGWVSLEWGGLFHPDGPHAMSLPFACWKYGGVQVPDALKNVVAWWEQLKSHHAGEPTVAEPAEPVAAEEPAPAEMAPEAEPEAGQTLPQPAPLEPATGKSAKEVLDSIGKEPAGEPDPAEEPAAEPTGEDEQPAADEMAEIPAKLLAELRVGFDATKNRYLRFTEAATVFEAANLLMELGADLRALLHLFNEIDSPTKQPPGPTHSAKLPLADVPIDQIGLQGSMLAALQGYGCKTAGQFLEMTKELEDYSALTALPRIGEKKAVDAINQFATWREKRAETQSAV